MIALFISNLIIGLYFTTAAVFIDNPFIVSDIKNLWKNKKSLPKPEYQTEGGGKEEGEERETEGKDNNEGETEGKGKNETEGEEKIIKNNITKYINQYKFSITHLLITVLTSFDILLLDSKILSIFEIIIKKLWLNMKSLLNSKTQNAIKS